MAAKDCKTPNLPLMLRHVANMLDEAAGGIQTFDRSASNLFQFQ